ncbi:DUF6542 domain-containing protein [Streptomyces sp. NPDC007088]|uniref:DUF6542 domain-containing protein n=1 Tax=Streptomyces sp. NPDC007088 TaxID=3364773 RepID=UPI0036BB17C7
MEQPSTRPEPRPRSPLSPLSSSSSAPLPPQGGRSSRASSPSAGQAARGSRGVRERGGRARRPDEGPSDAAYRASGSARPAVRLPGPRLTGLGAGLFAIAAMFLVAGISWLLFDGSPLCYGLLFVVVSGLAGVWVRPADLVTPPVAAPIAFALGMVPLSGGTGGIGGHLMGLLTALALHAGWLYAGTLLAALIVAVRKVRLMRRRRTGRAAPRPAGRRPGRAASPTAAGRGAGYGRAAGSVSSRSARGGRGRG